MTVPFDPFAAEQESYLAESSESVDTKYSQEKFYTASRGTKGDTIGIRVYMPHAVIGKVSAIIASKVVAQYRTPPDFYRDAIVHRAKYMGDYAHDGRFDEIATMLMIASDAEEFKFIEQEAEKALRDFEYALSRSSGETRRHYLSRLRQAVIMSTTDSFIDGAKRLLDRFGTSG